MTTSGALMQVASPFTRRGRVMRIDDLHAEVVLVESSARHWARCALPGGAVPGVGDEVLLVGGDDCETFLVAVLEAPRPTPTHLKLAGGARAEVVESEPEVLRVFSTEGELVLEYDSARGCAKLRAGQGDLEVVAERGTLRLAAAEALQLEAPRIDARSRELRLESGDAVSSSSLALSATGARLAAPLVETVAQRVEQRAVELRQTVQRLVTHAGDVRMVVEKLETIAGQLRERARRSYRVVEELAQLRAGRLRTRVADTYQLTARKTLMRAKRDFKVKGDQIHLG